MPILVAGRGVKRHTRLAPGVPIASGLGCLLGSSAGHTRAGGKQVRGTMAKSSAKTVFECSSCGRTTPKWEGKCSQCGEWNTVVAGRAQGALGRRARAPRGTPGQLGYEASAPLVELTEIPTNGTTHMATGIDELDRVLGGGFVAGSTTLLAGDPGIGKSTLLLQAAAAIAETGRKVLYATGEEALEQIRIRASRLGVKGDGVFMVGTGDAVEIAAHMAALNPAVVIVDSIQTATHPDLDSPAGTVSQIRECAAFLSERARSSHWRLSPGGSSVAGRAEAHLGDIRKLRGAVQGSTRATGGSSAGHARAFRARVERSCHQGRFDSGAAGTRTPGRRGAPDGR